MLKTRAYFLILVLLLAYQVFADENSDQDFDDQDAIPSSTLKPSSSADPDKTPTNFSELLTSNWQIPTALITAFILAYSVGANDVANPFGTAVGSGALTVKQVYWMASIFETAGAAMLGLLVAETIRSKLIYAEYFSVDCFVLGEICAMFGAAAWQIIATIFGLPVSGTHSIVGATVGFALVEAGPQAVRWKKIIQIVASWVCSPAMAGAMAAGLYIYIIKNKILENGTSYTGSGDQKSDPIRNQASMIKATIFWLPLFFAFTVAFNVWAIGSKGLKMFMPEFYETASTGTRYGVIFGAAIVLSVALYALVKYKKLGDWKDAAEHYGNIIDNYDEEKEVLSSSITATEKQKQKAIRRKTQTESLDHTDGSEDPVIHYLFSKLQAFAACFDAFAHGANDVGNSIGPVIACYAVLATNHVKGNPENFGQTQLIIVFYAAAGMVIGLLTLGRRVIQTVGSEITQLTPARGFSIDIMSGVTVVLGSYFQIPLSTTHCKVGAVVAVGLTYDKKSLKWETFKNILYAWVITVPASAGISAILYWVLKAALGYVSLTPEEILLNQQYGIETTTMAMMNSTLAAGV